MCHLKKNIVLIHFLKKIFNIKYFINLNYFINIKIKNHDNL